MTRLILAALILAGCPRSPISQPELARRIVDAGVTGWVSAGYDDPPQHCALNWFRVVFPTKEEFARWCPPGANACLYGFAAAIHPDLRGPVVERLAAHELAHLLSYCALGDMDYEHTNKRVWYPHEGSAETIARELLVD